MGGAPPRALEAALEAWEQGLIRWIGVTRHGSQIAATQRRTLDRHDFDSVLLPYNFDTMQYPYYAGNLRRGIHGDVPLGKRPEAGHPCRIGLAM